MKLVLIYMYFLLKLFMIFIVIYNIINIPVKYIYFPILFKYLFLPVVVYCIVQSAEGTGLAFVVFTEAILTFPWPSVFAFIFFAMLLTLGLGLWLLGSMIGTLQSVITSVRDSRFINASDPVITLFICGSACLVGLPFACRNGQYLVALFDQFAAKYGLICVVLSQLIAVNFGYGLPKYEYLNNSATTLNQLPYWRFSWRYASLAVMGFMCISAAISSMIVRPEYSAYDPISTKQFPAFYPFWTKCIAVLLIFTSIAPVPIMVLLYLFKAKNKFHYLFNVLIACLLIMAIHLYKKKKQQHPLNLYLNQNNFEFLKTAFLSRGFALALSRAEAFALALFPHLPFVSRAGYFWTLLKRSALRC
uniref:Uncharacterized protein n=1 Tax=Heterorhabditis bacteriophora TaxID=37862 RepID=A0A1I7WU80_HETBA